MKKYVIGIDFGSLSARALLIDVADGNIIAQHECIYPNGILSGIWKGKKLPDGVFLQVPGDYSHALCNCILEILKQTNTDPRQILALGIDATSATLVPVAQNGKALALHPRYSGSPFAQALMWKSHATQEEVTDICHAAKKFREPFWDRTGDNIPANSAIPKLLHLIRHAPAEYDATYRYYDLCDYIVYFLTGADTVNLCSAEGKFLWTKAQGWPSKAFFQQLHPKMANIIEKLPRKIAYAHEIAGTVTPQSAALTGLLPGTPVVTGLNDGISPLAAAAVTEPGKYMMVIGTSVSCFLLSDQQKKLEGLYGTLEDAPFPGLITYETGLQSFGDTLAWFAQCCCPQDIFPSAPAAGAVLDVLSQQASSLPPGSSRLLAMNWWNGNRSMLLDSSLTGCILGLTLQTKPEEIFRALAESMAFNFRMIQEEFERNNIPIYEIIAVGGIPQKNPFIMQLIADVLGCRITVPCHSQMAALGAAIFAAAAVGAKKGGYDSIRDAVENMSVKHCKEYLPNRDNTLKYRKLYNIYVASCHYLGQDPLSPIKQLSALRAE